MPASEVASHIIAPPGFHATLFAGEPDVCQPIAMAFDDRGRLWVVECYSYRGGPDPAFDPDQRDRILIFEDSKGAGRFDKRTVFWDQGVRLTSIALGFGGVFCLSAPNLLFIPVAEGGDKPAGPPEILLDGWNYAEVHHNIVNGLKWDPDADALGGVHAHSGLMIYQGDNWPEEYDGHLFTLNYHGRRINQDLLEPRGSGYVGRHGSDLVKFGDPWFRGIDLDYGPDGGVFVLDWSDTGECHGDTGVHRASGRIYKLTYNDIHSSQSLSLLTNSLANFSNAQLLELQFHTNEWYARHACRILQERAAILPVSFSGKILALYSAQTEIPKKLRLFFTLHAIGADSKDWLEEQLKDSNEHIRSWAVRFLGEDPSADWQELDPIFSALATSEASPVVRLSLASALQRMSAGARAPLAAALLTHGDAATDHNLPLMLWYGVEPVSYTHLTLP